MWNERGAGCGIYYGGIIVDWKFPSSGVKSSLVMFLDSHAGPCDTTVQRSGCPKA